MKPNKIYITTPCFCCFPFREAQKIEELTAVPLQIGYEKTLHLIFPTEVKYYSIGGIMSSVRRWPIARGSYA